MSTTKIPDELLSSGVVLVKKDTSGNVGIGVTPNSGWSSDWKTLDMGAGSAFAAFANTAYPGTTVSFSTTRINS